MMFKGKNYVLYFVIIAVSILCTGFDNSGKGLESYQDEGGNGGYLFAHMTTDDYGSLYYSMSRDGLNWKLLNRGRKINNIYRGHPDICKGGNGSYYMIGVDGISNEPVLWKSDSLIEWKKEKTLPRSAFLDNTPGYQTNPLWYGAPKMYFDEASNQYIISWHASETDIEGGNELWESMRTFYILTSDFNTFTQARRLFDFQGDADKEMATIDVIIRKNEGIYYAVIKDERWPESCPTGKTIRISTSENLTGPYSDPGSPITPSWYEAPSLVPKLDDTGWYLYAESYPNKYMLFEADSISGAWSSVNCNLDKVRHGCIVRLDEEQFNNIQSTYYNALPTVKISTSTHQSVLYSSAGNRVELSASDEDGTIQSANLFVDGVWIPEEQNKPNSYDIDFLDLGIHGISAEVVDDRGGVAKDSIEVIVADSLLAIEDWILYQKNGALATFSKDLDTIKINVERASGNDSDIMLLKEIESPVPKSSTSGQVSFMAKANRYTALAMAIKEDPYLEKTLISKSFKVSPYFDTYALTGIPNSDANNFLAFYLGDRNETSIHITDLRLDFLSSNKAVLLDNKENIYPNPVSEILHFPRETDFWIHTLSGNLILKGEKATKSDLSALPEGLYVVSTDYGNFKVTKE